MHGEAEKEGTKNAALANPVLTVVAGEVVAIFVVVKSSPLPLS
jgi:hypothetical protein